MAFPLFYTNAARAEIKALRAYDRQRLVTTIESVLRHQPTVTSRSRLKRMTLPYWSQYQLRVDEFRVYFDVDEVNQTVPILHVRQ
jgi:mRNA-degrading endonuclease RelE of RelBE toxin-antitoxin system